MKHVGHRKDGYTVDVEGISVFDANSMVGPTSTNTGAAFRTAEDLVAEMDRLGIQEALVYHSLAREGDPLLGNRLLIREIQDEARLHGCWVVLPPFVEPENPDPASLVQEMLRHDIRAVRMFPTAFRCTVATWSLGDLLSALERYRIPLFLDFDVKMWSDPFTDWKGVYEICTDFPDLPVVIVHEGTAASRRLYPLWRKLDNLYVETSYYQPHRAFEDICGRFGPERILFGTGIPVHEGGMPLHMLFRSGVREEDRRLIAGGNLRRLMEDVRAPSPPRRAAERGAVGPVQPPSPEGIMDAHGHIGRWPATYVPYGDAEGMLISMDRLGIERACVSAFLAVGPDYERGNDMVAEVVRRYPDRFMGYAVLNPNYPEDIEPELHRCFDELGMTAIKLHCELHDVPMDGEHYRKVFEFAEERGLTVLIHGAVVEDVLKRYPHVNLLSAHVGLWDGRSRNEVIELAKSYDNLYLDLAASLSYRGALKRMVEEVGADRIVHGSDFPLMDPGYQLGRVIYAEISEEDKWKILRDNARRLFDH